MKHNLFKLSSSGQPASMPRIISKWTAVYELKALDASRQRSLWQNNQSGSLRAEQRFPPVDWELPKQLSPKDVDAEFSELMGTRSIKQAFASAASKTWVSKMCAALEKGHFRDDQLYRMAVHKLLAVPEAKAQKLLSAMNENAAFDCSKLIEPLTLFYTHSKPLFIKSKDPVYFLDRIDKLLTQVSAESEIQVDYESLANAIIFKVPQSNLDTSATGTVQKKAKVVQRLGSDRHLNLAYLFETKGLPPTFNCHGKSPHHSAYCQRDKALSGALLAYGVPYEAVSSSAGKPLLPTLVLNPAQKEASNAQGFSFESYVNFDRIIDENALAVIRTAQLGVCKTVKGALQALAMGIHSESVLREIVIMQPESLDQDFLVDFAKSLPEEDRVDLLTNSLKGQFSKDVSNRRHYRCLSQPLQIALFVELGAIGRRSLDSAISEGCRLKTLEGRAKAQLSKWLLASAEIKAKQSCLDPDTLPDEWEMMRGKVSREAYISVLPKLPWTSLKAFLEKPDSIGMANQSSQIKPYTDTQKEVWVRAALQLRNAARELLLSKIDWVDCCLKKQIECSQKLKDILLPPQGSIDKRTLVLAPHASAQQLVRMGLCPRGSDEALSCGAVGYNREVSKLTTQSWLNLLRDMCVHSTVIAGGSPPQHVQFSIPDQQHQKRSFSDANFEDVRTMLDAWSDTTLFNKDALELIGYIAEHNTSPKIGGLLLTQLLAKVPPQGGDYDAQTMALIKKIDASYVCTPGTDVDFSQLSHEGLVSLLATVGGASKIGQVICGQFVGRLAADRVALASSTKQTVPVAVKKQLALLISKKSSSFSDIQKELNADFESLNDYKAFVTDPQALRKMLKKGFFETLDYEDKYQRCPEVLDVLIADIGVFSNVDSPSFADIQSYFSFNVGFSFSCQLAVAERAGCKAEFTYNAITEKPQQLLEIPNYGQVFDRSQLKALLVQPSIVENEALFKEILGNVHSKFNPETCETLLATPSIGSREALASDVFAHYLDTFGDALLNRETLGRAIKHCPSILQDKKKTDSVISKKYFDQLDSIIATSNDKKALERVLSNQLLAKDGQRLEKAFRRLVGLYSCSQLEKESVKASILAKVPNGYTSTMGKIYQEIVDKKVISRQQQAEYQRKKQLVEDKEKASDVLHEMLYAYEDECFDDYSRTMKEAVCQEIKDLVSRYETLFAKSNDPNHVKNKLMSLRSQILRKIQEEDESKARKMVEDKAKRAVETLWNDKYQYAKKDRYSVSELEANCKEILSVVKTYDQLFTKPRSSYDPRNKLMSRHDEMKIWIEDKKPKQVDESKSSASGKASGGSKGYNYGFDTTNSYQYRGDGLSHREAGTDFALKGIFD